MRRADVVPGVPHLVVLVNKVVIITGARGGLGNDVTNAFLESGASIVGVSRSIKDTDFTSDRFFAVPAELTSADAARKVVNSAVSQFGRIDILVHLLGGFAGGTVAGTEDAVYNQMLDVNLRSAFLMTRAVLPKMIEQKSGRIVAIGSRAAVEANAGAGVYGASKAALVALMRAVALENSGNGISANVILPGTMDTPANRAAMPKADWSKWVQPAQVASLIVAIVSDSVSQVSGAVIPIYGGEL